MKMIGMVGTVVWLCVVGFAWAEADPDWGRYADAKRQLQNGLHDLIVETRPELAGTAQTYRDMQLTLIELRSAKFKYLMATDPARIVRDQGLVAFVNFDWTERDAEGFALETAHAELQLQVKRLKESNNSDPRWPEMRTHFVTLSASSEYRQIMQTFMDAQNLIAADLK